VPAFVRTVWRPLTRPGERRRLASIDRDKLPGEIEVDESYLGGGVPGGKRGRGRRAR
jgi:hypothetical protein